MSLLLIAISGFLSWLSVWLLLHASDEKVQRYQAAMKAKARSANMTTKLIRISSVALLLFCLFNAAPAQSDETALHAILLDNSGSLRSQFERVRTLGTAVLRDAHKQGPISIFSFKEAGGSDSKEPPPLVVAHTIWNRDAQILSKYIDTLVLERGQTNLLDAIHSMAKHINAKAEQDKKTAVRKVLVLVTDGDERKSKIKEKELLAELQQHQIQVYAIGLVQELKEPFFTSNAKSKATKLLNKITKETGGRALFPRSNSGDVQALLVELFAPTK